MMTCGTSAGEPTLTCLCWYLAIPPVRLPYQQCSKYRATVVAHLFPLCARPQSGRTGASSVASNLPTTLADFPVQLGCIVIGSIIRTLPTTITLASLSMHLELTSLSMCVNQRSSLSMSLMTSALGAALLSMLSVPLESLSKH